MKNTQTTKTVTVTIKLRVRADLTYGEVAHQVTDMFETTNDLIQKLGVNSKLLMVVDALECK